MIPEECEFYNPSIEKKGSNKDAHYNRYYLAQQFCWNKRVLDIASGSGFGSDILSKVSSNVVGVDKNLEAITYSKKHYPNRRISYLHNDLISHFVTCRDFVKYDIMICFETLEHLGNNEIPIFFKTIPTNKMLLSIPSAKYIHNSRFHKTFITKKEVIIYLINNNFVYDLQYQHPNGLIDNTNRDVQNYIFICYKTKIDHKFVYSNLKNLEYLKLQIKMRIPWIV